MLETTVGNGADKLRLQQEVAETGRMDADVGTLLVDTVGSGSLRLLAVGRRSGLLSLELLVGVIDEILFGRHVGGWLSGGPSGLMVDGRWYGGRGRGRGRGRS